MGKNIKIALDVDGVIAGFYKAMCERFNKPYEKQTWGGSDYWIRPVFAEIENDYDFWFNLPLLANSHDITFDFDLYLTHCPEGPANRARIDWIKKHGFPDKPVVLSDEKAAYCLANDIDVLIDDKPSTIYECEKAGIWPIHFKPEYLISEKFDYQVTHLSEIPKLLGEIKYLSNY